ncbi:MAG: precorrin-2 C(20)-methyltransferase [Eubacteriales bacterium]
MITPGNLCGVGVGPGDPELLTLKAIKRIKEADIIAVPKTESKQITALNIVQSVIDLSGKEILELYMPMTREKAVLKEKHATAVEELTLRLVKGKNIVFLTIGDPSIYSTYIYLHKQVLKAGFNAELVPGVPSFCAVAAKLNDSLCLGAEPLHIIPASYEGLSDCLDWKGTKVLMKSGKELVKVREALEERDKLKDSSMVECCGMENEKVYLNLADYKDDTEKSYFTIIVVKDKENER